MKKSIIIFSAALLLAALPSKAQVSQTQQTTGASISHHEAQVAASIPKIFAVPLVADTELIPDAATTYQMKENIILPSIGVNESKSQYYANLTNIIKNKIGELKSKALFDYAEKMGADVILSPMYSITTVSSTGLLMTVNVKIKGYPAKYTNFRTLKATDYSLVQAACMVDGSSERQSMSNLTKNETYTTKEVRQ